MRPNRIEGLADGIFAIVMTILVLELKAPSLHGANAVESLVPALIELWPKFLSFVISFILLGIYWNSHHIMFSYIGKADFRLIWLNIFFFMSVSIVPFSTALLGEQPLNQVALIFYSLNLIICGLLIYWNWRYIAKESSLLHQAEFSDELRRNVRQKILVPPLLYFGAILASFIDTRLSLIFLILGPIIYAIPVDTKLWQILTFAPDPAVLKKVKHAKS